MSDSTVSEKEWEGETDHGEDRNSEDVLEFMKSMTDVLIEKVIPYKHKALTLKKAGNCLKVLGKIWNLSEYPPAHYVGDSYVETEEKLMDMEGYIDEYQYLHIEALNMGLTDVTILPKYFVWLLSVDLSGNYLTNVACCPLTKLPNLVALRLNRNRFRDPYMPPMKHLQYLGLNRNKIKSLHRIYHPNLETLDLNYNVISQIEAHDCWKLAKLTQLELRGNRLQTTKGIEYTSLVTLYLAKNNITQLRGMEILVNLERLHLRDNPLVDLTGFTSSNIKLKYLNVRHCKIEDVEEVKNLSVLKGLRELIIKENVFNKENEEDEDKSLTQEEKADQGDYDDFEDFEDDDDDKDDDKDKDTSEEEGENDLAGREESEEERENRIRILFYLPNLTRIDKKLVSKEEREAAKEL